MEVAQLVASGHSNRQIADCLVIAVSTAERHVANILRKLDATSRTQIASWFLATCVDPTSIPALFDQPRSSDCSLDEADNCLKDQVPGGASGKKPALDPQEPEPAAPTAEDAQVALGVSRRTAHRQNQLGTSVCPGAIPQAMFINVWR
jgi:hypothetical protein